MAKVILDVSVAGESWFTDRFEELVGESKVVFVYCEHERYLNELMRVPKLLELLKLMGTLGRRADVDASLCAKHIDEIGAEGAWIAESACDDPHVFAMAYEKPVKYVFTSDGRIATCRNCMRKVLNKRYCSFSLIRSAANYDAHRDKILS